MTDRLKTPASPIAADARAAVPSVHDAGLRSYMIGVYNYMASGVLLTAVVALLVAANPTARAAFFSATGAPTPLGWAAIFAPLVLVIAVSFGINRFSQGTVKTLFWVYAALMGVSLSTVLLAYTGVSVARTFFATSAAFAGLSLWGYATKKDLSAFGTFLIMGLFGLIIAMIINMFLRSSTMDLIVSGAGVLLFAGLTAYDTQKIRNVYSRVAGSDFQGRRS